MGSSVRAACTCGYETPMLMIGGGMRTFSTTCYWPCLCEDCREAVQANVLAKAPRCPKCKGQITPYGDPTLVASSGNKVVAEWNMENMGRHLILTNGVYRCPQCSQDSLRFDEGGICWD